MKIADNIIGNILGKPRVRGGRKDRDGDGVPNKKDCQPRNTMRQDKSLSDKSGYYTGYCQCPCDKCKQGDYHCQGLICKGD